MKHKLKLIKKKHSSIIPEDNFSTVFPKVLSEKEKRKIILKKYYLTILLMLSINCDQLPLEKKKK